MASGSGKVIVNGKYVRQRLTGVQRYAHEIMNCLRNRVHLIVPPENPLLSRGPLWEQFVLPARLHSNDLLWSPTNSGPLLVSKQIITIHDLSPIDHPEWFTTTFSKWYKLLVPQLAQKVMQIITDSLFSKERIISLLQVPEEKVIVIPLGVGENFCTSSPAHSEQIRHKYKLSGPYFLVVGSIEPRKNLPRFIQAWEKISSQFADITLAVVGSRGYPFRDPGFEDHCSGLNFLGRVPDEDLPSLYSGALFLAYPSVYEGFGLPVLEAMACGTPVVVSSAASLPEVAGDAGLFCNPYDVDDMTLAIRRMIEDSGLRVTLKEKGLQRVKSFSWDHTAQQVWQVLSACLEELNG